MGFSRNIDGRIAKKHWAEEVEMIFGLIALPILVHLLGEGPPGREEEEVG